MTKLDEIKERWRGITQGLWDAPAEWRTEYRNEIIARTFIPNQPPIEVPILRMFRHEKDPQTIADREFIMHAPSDIAHLIGLLEKRYKVVEAAKAFVRRCRENQGATMLYIERAVDALAELEASDG